MLRCKSLYKRLLTSFFDERAGQGTYTREELLSSSTDSIIAAVCIASSRYVWYYLNSRNSWIWDAATRTQKPLPTLQFATPNAPEVFHLSAGTDERGAQVVGVAYQSLVECDGIKRGDAIVEVWDPAGTQRIYAVNISMDNLVANHYFEIGSGLLFSKHWLRQDPDNTDAFILITRLRDYRQFFATCYGSSVLDMRCVVLPPSAFDPDPGVLICGDIQTTGGLAVFHLSGFTQNEPHSHHLNVLGGLFYAQGRLFDRVSQLPRGTPIRARQVFSVPETQTINDEFIPILRRDRIYIRDLECVQMTAVQLGPPNSRRQVVMAVGSFISSWASPSGELAIFTHLEGIECIYRPLSSKPLKQTLFTAFAAEPEYIMGKLFDSSIITVDPEGRCYRYIPPWKAKAAVMHSRSKPHIGLVV